MGSGGLLAKTVLLIGCLACGPLTEARGLREPAATSYWPTEIERWSNQVATHSAPTAEIREAAAAIIAEAATAEQKARRLYSAVQSLNVLASDQDATLPHQDEPRTPRDVWTQKAGSADEIAMLYLALSRAAGLDAYGLQVADRRSHLFDPRLLSFQQLDAFLVVVRIEGRDINLDPGATMCPFGQLAWYHTMAGGVSQNSNVPIQTPAGSANDALTARVAELSVDVSGKISGVVKVIMNGPQALYWRQLNLRTTTAETERAFARQFQDLLPTGMTVESAQFKGWHDSETFLRAIIEVHGTIPAGRTEKRIILPANLFSRAAHEEFAAEDPESLVDLRYPEQVIDELKLRFPPGCSVESAPQGIQFAWPERASLRVTASSAAGMVDVKYTFSRTFVAVNAGDYATMQNFYRTIAAIGERHIVLVSSTGM
jgi:hypothetical protein